MLTDARGVMPAVFGDDAAAGAIVVAEFSVFIDDGSTAGLFGVARNELVERRQQVDEHFWRNVHFDVDDAAVDIDATCQDHVFGTEDNFSTSKEISAKLLDEDLVLGVFDALHDPGFEEWVKSFEVVDVFSYFAIAVLGGAVLSHTRSLTYRHPVLGAAFSTDSRSGIFETYSGQPLYCQEKYLPESFIIAHSLVHVNIKRHDKSQPVKVGLLTLSFNNSDNHLRSL
jgi:hypothetical protein